MNRTSQDLTICLLAVFGLVTTQGFAAGKADRATCPSGMALIPGGRYVMGEGKSENDVKAFCLDITEVRVADYTRFSSARRQTRNQWVPDPSSCLDDSPGFQQFPVNCVDWRQATAYCAAQDQRLPTEEEWEWAARGTAKAWKFPWGNEAPWEDPNGPDGVCWRRPRGDAGCIVGTSRRDVSPEGVHDLYGSVTEWTSSAASQPADTRRARGECALCTGLVTVTQRLTYEPGLAASHLGFRCAATPAAPRTRAR